MEKNIIPDKRVIQDNHIPTPPTPEGDWRDKRRDHAFFQKKVSLAAHFGGVGPSDGCLTTGAEAARQAAENQHYHSKEVHPEKILEKKEIK